MPFISSTDICAWFSWTRMFLLNCPEAPAVRELKSKDRIEGATLSSIKLRFQMAKLETIRGVVHHPGRASAVTSASRPGLEPKKFRLVGPCLALKRATGLSRTSRDVRKVPKPGMLGMNDVAKTSKARAPAATMAGKITSLSLNRMKQPPKRKGTTINNNLSVAPLRR